MLAPEAVRDMRRLSSYVLAAIRTAVETHLRHEPTKLSKSRIKRLRGLSQPQYRLRVNHVRVFYDVEDGEVQILAVLDKTDAEAWLFREGVPS